MSLTTLFETYNKNWVLSRKCSFCAQTLLSMDFRTISEMEAIFRPVEQRLDAMLENARPILEHEQILLSEYSNRSRFGGHSHPAFSWSFQFDKREPFGSEIKRATTQLTHRVTELEGEPQQIEVTSIAEIFQIGKESRVREISKTFYPINQFLNMRVDQVIFDNIAAAEQILAKF